jgi:hypothetical protein
MKQILARLLRKGPKGYPRPVDVRWAETRVYEGHMKTADRLFTNERTPLKPLVLHVFVFELDGLEREFLAQDHDRELRVDEGRTYRAYLNASLDRCWFDGREEVVRIRLPDDDDEDEDDAQQ